MVINARVRRRLAARHVSFAGLAALALAIAIAVVPGAASAQPTVAGLRAGVPWRQAGPGWSVVQYSTANISGSVKGPTTLYLVSPAGRKYPFYRTAPATFPNFTLIDWSGDRRRILVQQTGSGDQRRLAYEQISLATRTVVTRFSLPSQVDPYEYTRPRGSGFLADGFGPHAGYFRYDLTGHVRAKLAPHTFLDGVRDAPDGSFLVAGTRDGIDLISNAGRITGHVRIYARKPAPKQFCARSAGGPGQRSWPTALPSARTTPTGSG